MTQWLLVTWIVWACPGGPLAGFWPASAKPLLCKPTPGVEPYDPARRSRAEARVRELGPGADLLSCRGGRCRSLARWSTELTFEK
jgi:hypothetical protein